ncbi:calponin homology domain-containing protein DDB_G0272472-like isoform X3 [Lepisosteus oculatus]|uniref:calponin homology domain-containing protein DDB_G0272472-like isoform X3 n=1 Tax=Lepisosteus oculatus TaxID=7918 RepID=UPI00371E5B99
MPFPLLPQGQLPPLKGIRPQRQLKEVRDNLLKGLETQRKQIHQLKAEIADKAQKLGEPSEVKTPLVYARESGVGQRGGSAPVAGRLPGQIPQLAEESYSVGPLIKALNPNCSRGAIGTPRFSLPVCVSHGEQAGSTDNEDAKSSSFLSSDNTMYHIPDLPYDDVPCRIVDLDYEPDYVLQDQAPAVSQDAKTDARVVPDVVPPPADVKQTLTQSASPPKTSTAGIVGDKPPKTTIAPLPVQGLHQAPKDGNLDTKKESIDKASVWGQAEQDCQSEKQILESQIAQVSIALEREKKSCSEFREKLQMEQSRHQVQKAKNDQAQQALKQEKTASSKLREELQEVKKSEQKKEAEIKQLTAALDKVKAIRVKLEEDLKTENIRYRKQAGFMQDRDFKINQLLVAQESSRIAKENLTVALKSEQSRCKDLISENKAKQLEIQELSAALEHERIARQILEKEMQGLKSEQETRQSEVQKLSAALARDTSECKNLTVVLEAEQILSQNLSAELQEKESKISQLVSELEESRKKLQEAEKHLNKRLAMELTEEKHTNQKLKEKAEALASEQQGKEEAISQLHAALEEARSANTSLCEAQEKERSRYQIHIVDARDRLAKTKRLLEAEKKQSAELCKAIKQAEGSGAEKVQGWQQVIACNEGLLKMYSELAQEKHQKEQLETLLREIQHTEPAGNQQTNNKDSAKDHKEKEERARLLQEISQLQQSLQVFEEREEHWKEQKSLEMALKELKDNEYQEQQRKLQGQLQRAEWARESLLFQKAVLLRLLSKQEHCKRALPPLVAQLARLAGMEASDPDLTVTPTQKFRSAAWAIVATLRLKSAVACCSEYGRGDIGKKTAPPENDLQALTQSSGSTTMFQKTGDTPVTAEICSLAKESPSKLPILNQRRSSGKKI